VTPADVPEQLLKRPPRAGRHRRRRIGIADELTEQRVLLEQSGDVIHDEIIAYRTGLLKAGPVHGVVAVGWREASMAWLGLVRGRSR
jgi:hypothetical protein